MPAREFDAAPVLAFLPCRSPAGWVDAACGDVDTLLLDHATLELKAAEQAQKLIRKYGGSEASTAIDAGPDFRSRLTTKMSKLAREELRHFELVVALIEQRGDRYRSLSSSRYASSLHAMARKSGKGELVDLLIIGAIIEARSCERFLSLVENGKRLDDKIAKLYSSLLLSEARHFQDYLALAKALNDPEYDDRLAGLLEKDKELIETEDSELRFHSGVPAAA